MPIAEIKRLRHQVETLDDHLYRQKGLLKAQSCHLRRLLTRRSAQALRSPWAVFAAFALGLVAGRVVAARKSQPSESAQPRSGSDNLARFQTLLPLVMELWPTLQTVIGQFAAGWAARKSGS